MNNKETKLTPEQIVKEIKPTDLPLKAWTSLVKKLLGRRLL